MYYDKRNIYITQDKSTLFDLNKNDIYEIDMDTFNKFEQIYNNTENVEKNQKYFDIYNLFFNDENIVSHFKFNIYQVKICVSNICNLSCKHCNINKNNYDFENSVMSRSIAKKICNFIIGSLYNITNIIFYGGEPLLAIDAIEEICDRLSSLNINFTINTNLTVLNDKIIKVINKYNIDVVAKIDGPKEVHDKDRLYKENGLGSYDTICKNAILLKNNTNALNTIVAKYTSDTAKKYTMKEISEFLYNKFKVKNISIGNVDNSYINFSNMYSLKQEVENLFDNIINGKYVDLSYNSIPFTTFFSKCHANNFCTSGITSILIMPNGDMWPCKAFVGNKEFYMGTLNCDYNDLNLIKFVDIRQMMSKIEKSEFETCNKCIAKFWCVKCIGGKSVCRDDIVKQIFNEGCTYNERLTILVLEQLSKVLQNGQFQVLHDNLEKASIYNLNNC